MKSDGFSLDSSRRRLKDKPIPKVVDTWKKRAKASLKNRKLQYFNVPFTEIKENNFEINFNFYQDFIYEPKSYRKASEILEQLNELESEIFSGLDELKRS